MQLELVAYFKCKVETQSRKQDICFRCAVHLALDESTKEKRPISVYVDARDDMPSRNCELCGADLTGIW